MKRAAPNPAVSTQIKDGLNTFLNTTGLQISTTRADRLEQTRLEKLVARGHWNTAPFSEGLLLNPERHLAFLKSVCEPYSSELAALPVADLGAEDFFRNNEWFESVDADVLYGVIRHFRPARIIEIGSGYSSRLATRAICDGELATKLICVDPSPRVEIRRCAHEFIQSPVEDLSASELAERLDANDLLFIDSSHVITTGGDVPYLYLQVLPRLRPGVLVHAHDIFLPFEYPQEFTVKQRWGWNEQYLLYALLIGNTDFEILWPSCYMWQSHQDQVRNVIIAEKSFPPPSSFWLRKKA
jgi:predicted O-methyltransferase YrrM